MSYFAFGADTACAVPVAYTTKKGVPGTACPMPVAKCGGNIYGVQQMLLTLGFDPQGIDGIYGKNTWAALKAFAASVGVAYSGTGDPSAALCSALIAAYAMKTMAPPVTSQLPTFFPASVTLPGTPATSTAPAGYRAPATTPGSTPPVVPAPTPETTTVPPLAPEGGFFDKATARWTKLSTTEQAAIAVGAVVVIGSIGYLAFGRKRPRAATATANRRRRAASSLSEYPSCRGTPPKKHRRRGATKRRDYAFPECWAYPVYDTKRARAAAARFAQHGGNVPASHRAKVQRRIEAAKRRFGIGA